jgi:hypothetical protein
MRGDGWAVTFTGAVLSYTSATSPLVLLPEIDRYPAFTSMSQPWSTIASSVLTVDVSRTLSSFGSSGDPSDILPLSSLTFASSFRTVSSVGVASSAISSWSTFPFSVSVCVVESRSGSCSCSFSTVFFCGCDCVVPDAVPESGWVWSSISISTTFTSSSSSTSDVLDAVNKVLTAIMSLVHAATVRVGSISHVAAYMRRTAAAETGPCSSRRKTITAR